MTGQTVAKTFMSLTTKLLMRVNSILVIGGRDNTVSENLCKGGWNTAVMLWHCTQITVSDNKIEKTNFSIYNGQGVLSDSWGAGIVADGDDNIYTSSTYQARITNNVITEPSIGRAVAIYAIRIMNDPFEDGDFEFDLDLVSFWGRGLQSWGSWGY